MNDKKGIQKWLNQKLKIEKIWIDCRKIKDAKSDNRRNKLLKGIELTNHEIFCLSQRNWNVLLLRKEIWRYGIHGYGNCNIAGNLGRPGSFSFDLHCKIQWTKGCKAGRKGKNYQTVIENLTEKFQILNQVQNDLKEIKDNLLNKN